MTSSQPDLPGPLADGVGSQTLDRGIRVLSAVCSATGPVSVVEIAAAVGLHRSICYRIVRTLEHHDLLERDSTGGYRAGGGLAVLAGRVEPEVQARARPALELLAEESGMTAFVVVAHGDQAVTVLVTEPRGSLAHVSYRPGARHPLTSGAPGLAILAGRPPQPGERAAVNRARLRGWATSFGEVVPGYRSLAAPVREEGRPARAAVAVVYAGAVPEDPLAVQVLRAAAQAAGEPSVSGAGRG